MKGWWGLETGSKAWAVTAVIAVAIFGASIVLSASSPAPAEVVTAAVVPFAAEIPVINLDRKYREWNWGGGSCVHASTVMVLRFSGNTELAAWWRKTYSGGESYNGLTSKLTRNKVPWYSSYDNNRPGPPNDVAGQIAAANEFADIVQRMGGTTYGTANGDARVLDRCIQERRGAVIFYYPNHSIMLVHIDAEQAIVLDNNRINEFIRIPRERFIREWQGYGGVAVVPVIGSPRPPQPWKS